MGRAWRWVLGSWLLGCSLSCAGRVSSGTGRSRSAEESSTSTSRGADVYSSRPTPLAVRGGDDAEQLNRELKALAHSRGMELTGDGRLAEVATFVGSNIDPNGRPPPSAAVDGFAHRVGLIEPVPLLMIFGENKEHPWTESMTEMLAGAPRNIAYNRSGVVVLDRFGQRIAVVALSASCAEITPLPRRAREGSKVPLHGRLREGYRHPQVELTLPDGSVEHVGDVEHKAGATFDFAIPIAARGVHRVEILADGAFGIEVLANFPLLAGVDDPPLVLARPEGSSAEEPTDSSAVAVQLLSLLNASRKSAGIAPLQAHAALAEVAEAHSRDMVEAGFFGHLSPVNGDPATRVRRRGLGFVLIAENVGRGSTADEVNSMLLDSPGHRANSLDPNLTHVGIGVVIDKRGGHSHIVATEDFGGVARPVDVGKAPEEVLRLINARRASAGAAKLEVDRTLTEAAQRGAERFLREPTQTQQQVVESVNGALTPPVSGKGSPIGKRMRSAQSFLLTVVALDHVAKIEQAFDPAARYIGLGIGQGNRPETGSTLVVVMVIGWPR